LVLLVPFEVKIEQVEASACRESKLPEKKALRGSALFKIVTKLDTCISRGVPGLGSLAKQISKPVSRLSAICRVRKCLRITEITNCAWDESGWDSIHLTVSLSSEGRSSELAELPCWDWSPLAISLIKGLQVLWRLDCHPLEDNVELMQCR
jgi:hypothetical protein